MYSTTNEWWIYFEALDKITCDKIRNLAGDKWENSEVNKRGIDVISAEERKVGVKPTWGENKKARISDVVWTTEQWIYDMVWPWMLNANERAGWKYDIECAELMQITRYKKGGFYRFHFDGKGDHLSVYDNPNNDWFHGRVRKLSMTILLNDNFEGGNFQFTAYKNQKCEIITPEFNKTGSIIVFPSVMEHRVTPVTKGIRYSLVIWFLGPPFR